MAGKGSRQRPVDRDRFASNWDRIFGKKEEGKMRATEMRNDLRRWAEAESLQQPESKPQPASVPAKGGKGS